MGAIIFTRQLLDEFERECRQFNDGVHYRLCRLEDYSSIPDVRGVGPSGNMQLEGICSYRRAGNPDHIADSPSSDGLGGSQATVAGGRVSSWRPSR